MTNKSPVLSPEALDFAPGLLAIQESPPARLPRSVMYTVAALFTILVLWAVFGKLNIIASAEGRLVPQTYVKIVQPADAGIVQEILVKEGQKVEAGQVLMRMDTKLAEADAKTIGNDLSIRSLQLRRIDAELNGTPLLRKADDPADLFRQVDAQYRDHRQSYLDALEQAQAALSKAQREYDSAKDVLAKLEETTPILKQQAEAYADMGKEGYAPQVTVRDKQREYLEKARDLRAQESTVASLEAAINQAKKQIDMITSKYRSDLRNERMDAEGQYRKLGQDWVKQEHKNGLLELRAPQAGIVNDLATHTAGTVVSPGTVLLSIVPENEPLIAEISVKNDDVGFVYPKQKVKVKLAAYPFEEYGMLDGEVIHIGPDASTPDAQGKDSNTNKQQQPSIYKAIVALDQQTLDADGKQHKLVAGMQVVAEINQGRRTVMQYLLSPVTKTFDESGHER
ncbi:HlyD family type I secretion periplasmic adaptor subunit [Sideroxydans lithotrophicus]|uniref:Membrane fusion protein (MFP) family protein n=1 Tax=Sideroxydans lithotrophicus (strain ES-1) TaxID=580332 RepID=D5CS95_SIDLE|nr:HlyD family type I secretion periplasmic adaptor subunit [Sideroxydans lithotrophicus]ADE11831.1 type I secretion membrane fusion protein, HlyD family [Sideroxydans lithotrophicus ES-1]